MNLAVNQQHIMQAIDWSRFDLEGWLYQFGAWQNTIQGSCGKSLNPIAVAMDQAVVKQKKFKLGVRKKRQVIADAISSDVDFTLTKKQTPKDTVCEITDNEARAVQRLVLDMQGKSEILDDWLLAIIERYFYFNSWSEMRTCYRTEHDAKQDVKCGLAALHVRYGFIRYKN
jgi:hypothetical protein